MISDYLNRTSIVLVTERWLDSLTLLAVVFGVSMDPKDAEVKLNQKGREAKEAQGSVDDMLHLQSFLSSETYVYTVYTAAYAHFEDDMRSVQKGAALGSRASLASTDLIPPACE
eukprot:CAMPEP_0119520172 /NCGR_PEP_ID=MMETSP1344-20130328/36249_1 /TAXON_ID=236787 /ORGANISM="Florenciella parvula, Strain CCMP2471" /LENGTH=113 /DNA_ID=CAMNT_0007558025 /DNA_START=3 /DNA_END=344 /DNA_ORIENTATION=-